MFSLEVNDGKETKTEKALKALLKSNGAYVEIGHFSESGMHPEADITFVDLMKYHSAGDPSKLIPSRPVLEILKNSLLQVTKNIHIGNALKRFKEQGFEHKALGHTLRSIGLAIGEEEVDIFGSRRLIGNSERVKAIKGEDAPLVDTQALVEEVSYRDSISKTIHKVL